MTEWAALLPILIHRTLMLVINDVHIGFRRSGGTTSASQEALRKFLFTSLRELLDNSDELLLVIMGDLFDDFEIPSRDLLETFMVLQGWLDRDKGLILVAGNHDHSPRGDKVSSFETLARILLQTSNDVSVVPIESWMSQNGNIFVAHHSNQDSFEKTLEEVLAEVVPGNRVFLHANYDNNFAAQTDHSLNVSRDLARKFAAKGATLYFAHEHQAREALSGSVVVLGNQWPTSIADCLNNTEKYAHVFQGSVQRIQTWSYLDAGSGYDEVDWRELSAVADRALGFLRVSGSAASSEAAEAINAIAKFRSKSAMYVIGNNVKVEGMIEAEALPESFEAAKTFDVMEYIEQHLDAEEMSVVRSLLEKCSD